MNRIYSAFNGLVRGKVSVTHNSETDFQLLSGKTKKRTQHALIICFGMFCLFGFQTPLQAQTTGQKGTANALTGNTPAREGTYQLIFNSKREDKDIKLTLQELIVIERLRKDTEVVYAAATYSDDIRVKILPRNVITGKDFTPVPLKYYKEEESYNEYSQIRYVELQ